MKDIGLGKRLGVLWRSLWIQASWSFKGMQTVGLVHTVGPALDAVGEKRCERLLRHVDFFNSHPFFAPMVAGALIRAENRGGEEAANAPSDRALLMGPLGGMGDMLFWGSVKPLAVVASLILLAEGYVWAPLAFVAFFVAVNLFTRVVSLELGLRRGRAAIMEIQRMKPVLTARAMKLATAFLLGWLLWRLSASWAPSLGLKPEAAAAGAVVLAIMTAWAARREVDPLWIIYFAAFAAVGIGYLK